MLGISAIAFGYATTWNEGYMPAGPGAAVVLDQGPRSAGRLVVRVVHGRVRRSRALYLLKAYAERRYSGGAARGCARAPPAPEPSTGGRPHARARARLDANVARTETPDVAAAAAAGDPLALWLAGLPSLARLDMLTYRIIAVGLPLLSDRHHHRRDVGQRSVGRLLAVGSEGNRGALVVDRLRIVHALHTRNAWRGERSAWVSIVGFVSIMFCYLGVNIWISGLHSYKM